MLDLLADRIEALRRRLETLRELAQRSVESQNLQRELLDGSSDLLNEVQSLVQQIAEWQLALAAGEGLGVAEPAQSQVSELTRTIQARGREVPERQEAERQFREIVEGLDAIVWEADATTWQFTFVSRRAEDILGYPVGQWLSEANFWVNHIHPDDRVRAVAICSEATAKGEDHQFDYRALAAAGHEVWLRDIVRVVKDRAGRPSRLHGVMVDITEREQRERMLRESEERFRKVFEEGPLGMSIIGLDNRILRVNGALCALLGYPAEELTALTFPEITHPHDIAKQVELTKQVFAGEIPNFLIEERLIKKNAEILWVNLAGTVIWSSEGAPMYGLGMIEDITERKRAEAELRESEERFRNMANAAPVMIWVSGPDKICTFVNEPWLDFTGRSLEQELGVGWSEDVHLEDRDRCLATYNSSCDARHPFEMEYRLRRADAEYRWVLDNGTPLYRGGEFVGFIGSCIDITERKLIEERLRANEARLKDAQRLAKVGSWERHLEADRIQWSEEMIRIFGLPDGPPSNFQSFLDRVHPKDREKVLETDRKNRSSLEPVEVEHRIIRPDGEVRFVRAIVEAIRDDQGEAVRLTGATQDVTEQVVASELLRQSERRLKNAERLAHLGYWQWDLQNNHLIWSEECFHIYGQPSDYTPSLERTLQAMVPEDRERVERETGHRLAEKTGGAIEFRIVRPDGDLRTIRSISEILLDEEGQPASFFGACQDITEEKRAQEESFARQKLESVGTLASGIAHDFNNLLGGVLAQAELGLAELAAGSNPEAELQAVRDAALRGSEIVREMMIYAGQESAVVGLVGVSQVVKEMLELLRVSVSKHAMLKTDLDTDLSPVRANAAQISQLVMNLVTNASDAIGDRDGVIGLTTKFVKIGRDSGAISDRLAEGDYVQLEVSDTGQGMLPETQAKVFDPFFTTKSAGHGLGLAIVQGIVRAVGGSIHLTSAPGKGTRFEILLPCAENIAGTEDRPMSRSELPPRRSRMATVLVVEDEDPLRQAASKMLRKAGFSVIEANDGSAALDAIRTQKSPIDVLLLDVTLPGAPSRDVFEEGRRLRPEMRVVITSAYNEAMAAASLPGRVERFIRKPYQLGDLTHLIQEILS
jgi:two-component system, cell cycle sensor histidine kinase and response regulator CckA